MIFDLPKHDGVMWIYLFLKFKPQWMEKISLVYIRDIATLFSCQIFQITIEKPMAEYEVHMMPT